MPPIKKRGTCGRPATGCSPLPDCLPESPWESVHPTILLTTPGEGVSQATSPQAHLTLGAHLTPRSHDLSPHHPSPTSSTPLPTFIAFVFYLPAHSRWLFRTLALGPSTPCSPRRAIQSTSRGTLAIMIHLGPLKAELARHLLDSPSHPGCGGWSQATQLCDTPGLHGSPYPSTLVILGALGP